MLGGGQVPSFHDGQEQADRLLALATDGLVHRRQRGVHVRGEVDVVETDEPHDIINPDFADGKSRAARSYYHEQMVALLEGRVDAIFAKGAEVAQLEREAQGRIRRLFDVSSSPELEDRVNNSTPRLLTASESLIRNHPQAVVLYVRTLVRAAHWAMANRDGAARAIAAETGIAAQDIFRCFEPSFPEKLMPTLNEDARNAGEIMKSFLLERGYISEDFDLEDWIEPNMLAEALEREQEEADVAA